MFLVNIGNHLVVMQMFECHIMACESVIYKSKLLCGSINKHDCELNITSWSKKIVYKFQRNQRKTVLRGHEIHSSNKIELTLKQ